MKNIRIFYLKNCHFLVVKFSVYLNRHVFVMCFYIFLIIYLFVYLIIYLFATTYEQNLQRNCDLYFISEISYEELWILRSSYNQSLSVLYLYRKFVSQFNVPFHSVFLRAPILFQILF